MDLTWTEEILGKIPNIRKLKMKYGDTKLSSSNCLEKISRLDKLQLLMCGFKIVWFPPDTSMIKELEFPLSLKKLTLWRNDFHWEDMATKVGSLPNLEKLKLIYCHAGNKWNSVDEKFLRLKYLMISGVKLRYWRADETRFPCLERLVLENLPNLKDIPYGIGDIQSLQMIELESCSSSTIASAKKILKEQQEIGNESFRLFLN